jgi:hypothetical protein
MMSDKDPSTEPPGPPQPAPASRARYQLLCSMLTTYGYGLVGLAVAPAVIPVRQPPITITLSEIGLALAFLAAASFIAPRVLD